MEFELQWSLSMKSFYMHLIKREKGSEQFPARLIRKVKATPGSIFLLGKQYESTFLLWIS